MGARWVFGVLIFVALALTRSQGADSDRPSNMVRIWFEYQSGPSISYSCVMGRLVKGEVYVYYDREGELGDLQKSVISEGGHITRHSDLRVPRELSPREMASFERWMCYRSYEEVTYRMAEDCRDDGTGLRETSGTAAGDSDECRMKWESDLSESHQIDSFPEHGTFWCETDFEPDDWMALKIIPEPDYLVLDRNDVDRRRMAQTLFGAPKLNLVVLCPSQGFLENRRFLESENRRFLESEKAWADLFQGPAVVCERDYETRFHEFAWKPSPVMISYKPMYELFAWFLRDPVAVKKLTGRVLLYAYGGYNFRSLTRGEDALNAKLTEMLKSFRLAVIYESWYATGDNVLNPDTATRLYEEMGRRAWYGDKFIEKLTAYNQRWNQQLLKRTEQSLEHATEDQVERRQKIIASIKAHPDQYLLGDSGLAAMLRFEIPARVDDFHFEGVYTKFKNHTDETTCSSSNIAVYQGLGFEWVVQRVMRWL